MATLLNPHFCINLFEAAFDSTTRLSDRHCTENARALFQKEFTERRDELARTSSASHQSQQAVPTPTPSTSTAAARGGIFFLNKSKQTAVVPSEISAYFEGQHPMADLADARNPDHMLLWWKVRLMICTTAHLLMRLTLRSPDCSNTRAGIQFWHH